MGCHGQTLVSLLVVGTIGIIISVALSRSIIHQYKLERGITANLEMDEISSLIHMLIDSPAACKKSGLIGKNLTPLLTPPGFPVNVTLSLANSAGPGTIVAGSQVRIGSTRKIASLRITGLASIDPPAIPKTNYIATMELTTAIVGSATTSRPGKKKFTVPISIDNTNRIISCSGSTPNTSSCPSATDYNSCPVNSSKYKSISADLVLYPSLYYCPLGDQVQTVGIHAAGTANCPQGWRPAGGGGECQFTANSWEAGVDLFGPPAGGGMTLSSKPNFELTGWFMDCCVIVAKSRVLSGSLYDGMHTAAGKNKIVVTCVPE